MAFCTKCGNEVTEIDAFCGKCGATRVGATTAGPTVPPPVNSAVERDAKSRLKREHDKLITTLGLGGGILTIVACFALLMIADAMGSAVGGVFVGLVALAAAAVFVASFVPRYTQAFRHWFTIKKITDPATGRPLQMLWWLRWFTAVLAVFMFVGLGDYVAPPPQAMPTTGSAQTADSVEKPLSGAERRAGIAAICVATTEALAYPSGKDPLDMAVMRAKEFAPSDARGGWVVSHLLAWLYRRGPSKARLQKLNRMARRFNNPHGVTQLTEASWTESDCLAAEARVGAATQVPPLGSIGQVFASETR